MLYDESTVEAISTKVLENLTEKIKNDIADSFYDKMQGYLYEHYDNATNNVKKLLIEELAKEFSENMEDHEFKKIRDRIFNENKDEIISTITDEKIKESLDKIIYGYDHKEFAFSWKWDDYVASHILKNISKYSENDRVLSILNNEISRRDSIIAGLKEDLEQHSTF